MRSNWPDASSPAGCVALAAALAALLLVATPAHSDTGAGGFRFELVDEKSLGLWEGDRPVLVYRFGTMRLPGVPMAGERSSYVHPIYGLDGEVLTDDFPADHYHHHGLFWGWPHVTLGEREYDLWKMRGIRIEFQKWLSREATAGRAKLGIENGWFVRDRQVMREEAWFEVHPESAMGRFIDVTLKWSPTEEPITLGGAEGKSYGGLSLRFAPRSQTVVTTPSGRAKEDLLISRLPWADLSGSFDGAPGPSGIAVLVHPRHPDFPPEWMTRDYGLLAVGWPGVKAATLAPGELALCQYRLWIHRGAPDPAKTKAVFQAYSKRNSSAH